MSTVRLCQCSGQHNTCTSLQGAAISLDLGMLCNIILDSPTSNNNVSRQQRMITSEAGLQGVVGHPQDSFAVCFCAKSVCFGVHPYDSWQWSSLCHTSSFGLSIFCCDQQHIAMCRNSNPGSLSLTSQETACQRAVARTGRTVGQAQQPTPTTASSSILATRTFISSAVTATRTRIKVTM